MCQVWPAESTDRWFTDFRDSHPPCARKGFSPHGRSCPEPDREVVERGLPELLAAGGGGAAAGAGLGEQLVALRPDGFRALLAAIHAVTRSCLRHFCACATRAVPHTPCA